MKTASNLDALYDELKQNETRSLLEIPSRNPEATLFLTPSKLRAESNHKPIERTWQQHDLFVFSQWLPGGYEAVMLNFGSYYFPLRAEKSLVIQYMDTAFRFLRQAKSAEGTASLEDTYLCLATLKNLFLIENMILQIDPLANKTGEFRPNQLSVALQIIYFKSTIVSLIQDTCTVLRGLKGDDVATGIQIEMLDELDAICQGFHTLAARRNLGPIQYPRERIPVETSPLPQAQALPARVIIDLQAASHDSASDYFSDSGDSDIEAECVCTLPKKLALFSGCLPFLNACLPFAKITMEEEPRPRVEMQEMGGYVAMEDSNEVTPLRGSNPRGQF